MSSNSDDPIWEFVEPDDCIAGAVRHIRVKESDIIKYQKKRYPYLSDEVALADFVAVHWARKLES